MNFPYSYSLILFLLSAPLFFILLHHYALKLYAMSSAHHVEHVFFAIVGEVVDVEWFVVDKHVTTKCVAHVNLCIF